ncbi:WD40 repeat-like protein [Amylocystis lapponica]|nr:WD40 repeat-like protein [Amylocystis lapponica]
MSSQPLNSKDDSDEIPPPQRPPSPPPHTTFSARNIHVPTFSAFRPRDIRVPSPQSMNHIAWSCDGKRLGAVGIDKVVRLWWPDKSVSRLAVLVGGGYVTPGLTQMELRSATMFSGGHVDDVDYLSWNPTHPDLFCTSSQKDRRVVFWDTRRTPRAPAFCCAPGSDPDRAAESRYIQQLQLKYSPVQTNYAPDGRTILYTSAGKQMFVLTYGVEGEDAKEQWRQADREPPPRDVQSCRRRHRAHPSIGAYDTHLDYPSLSVVHSTPAHVGGCVAAALDPRGRYLASGGHDSIVNLFDLSEWICSRTITACDNAISALSFSHDGEFLAISNAGSYIDICATETGVPLHRVPALGPSPTVSWHPSRYVIAYCGQTKIREGGPPPSAWISLFGPGMSN